MEKDSNPTIDTINDALASIGEAKVADNAMIYALIAQAIAAERQAAALERIAAVLEEIHS